MTKAHNQVTTSALAEHDIVPSHDANDALARWKADRGYSQMITYIAEDFDAPLAADILITPSA
jgi:hypothetical protein